MQIAIVMPEGTLPIEVHPMETILEVKQKIELLLGISVARQALSIYNFELADELEIEFYHMVEGMPIDFKITPLKFQISVKISTREMYFEVDGSETVLNLKENIHKYEGSPIKQMVLMFLGIKMADDRYLSEYGITNNSEIIVILKPKRAPRKANVVPQPRRVDVVVQTPSFLNSVTIPLELNDSDAVSEVKLLLLEAKLLPQDDYFFVHKQRIMRDKQSLHWHGVKNGDSLYVFRGTGEERTGLWVVIVILFVIFVQKIGSHPTEVDILAGP
ncbi:ubiquitin-like superfamily protein [Tasmannia lanceolata]|uniref:ubiquitin-like superfamily protein n=1 Tax=Tasmannia lanceolata TaxID=3420 RepID=UPI00406326E9